MLMLRLQRIGKKKSPTYRLIVSEKTKDTHDRHVELLGHYNPVQQPKATQLKEERIKYWISKGAQTSSTVENLLINAGVIEGKKKKSVVLTDKRRKKIGEKQAAADDAKKAADAKKAEALEAEKKAAEEAAAVKVEEVKEPKEAPVAETVEVVETPEAVAEVKVGEVTKETPEPTSEETAT